MPQKKSSHKNEKTLLFGWKTGLEPATLGTTNRYSNQLSYNHHVNSGAKINIFSFLKQQIIKLIYLNFLYQHNVLT